MVLLASKLLGEGDHMLRFFEIARAHRSVWLVVRRGGGRAAGPCASRAVCARCAAVCVVALAVRRGVCAGVPAAAGARARGRTLRPGEAVRSVPEIPARSADWL